MLQRAVPHLMPIAIVQALEPVQVQHHQRQSLIVALDLAANTPKLVRQPHTVGQPGQTVGTGQFDKPQLVVDSTTLIDMREHHHRQTTEANVGHHHHLQQSAVTGQVADVKGHYAQTDKHQGHPETAAPPQQQVGNNGNGLNPGEHRKGGVGQHQRKLHDAEKRHQVGHRPAPQVRSSADNRQQSTGKQRVGYFQASQRIEPARKVDGGEHQPRHQGNPQQGAQHRTAMFFTLSQTLWHPHPHSSAQRSTGDPLINDTVHSAR